MVKIQLAGESQSGKVAIVKSAPAARAELDKIQWTAKEPPLDLAKYKPLTAEELHLLNGILLFQQGDKCAVAVGLFYPLTKTSPHPPPRNSLPPPRPTHLRLPPTFSQQ